MDNFEFLGLNLGKLPNYVQYFGSNNVEGVAVSWVEAEMNWVEVEMSCMKVNGAALEVGGGGWCWMELGARFSNTRI